VVNEGLEVLRGDLGTLYFKDSLFRPVIEKKEIQYGKNHLQIGRRMDGSVFTLDLSEACRISGVGATRSGKTFLMRAIADRLYQIAKSILYISDIKSEFFSSVKPVQSKFRENLLEGEEPKAMKIVSLRPTFFRTIDKERPPHSFWYSVNFKDVSRADFLTLLNAEELTQNQRVALEIIYQRLEKSLKKQNLSFSIPLMNEIIDSVEELSTMQKNALKFKFMPLEQAKFFVERYERSVSELIEDNFAVTINLENFDRFGKGGFNFPEVVMSIVLREVIQARRDKKIKPLWIMMDEAGRFIGQRRDNSLKDQVLESIDVDGRYGVNWFFMTQNIEDLPVNVLRQSKYIFVPATADVNSIQFTLMNTGLVKNQQIAKNESIRLKKMMVKVPYSWIILNRMAGSIDFIRPLAPLSHHLETSKE
jgi:hypothetical protein